MNFRIYIKKRLLDGTWSDPLCIQDSFMGLKEAMLLDPKLTKKKNSAGSFEAKLHSDNIALTTTDFNGNAWIEKGNTRIFIKAFQDEYELSGLDSNNGKIIWDGRVLSSDSDFYNQPKIYAEGALAYLNDTIQPKIVFKRDSTYYWPAKIFQKIIENHNAKDTSDIYTESIKFEAVTEYHSQYINVQYGTQWPSTWDDDTSSFTIGEESTMTSLTNFIAVFGGSIRVTWALKNGVFNRQIEWITEDYDISKQNDPSTVSFSVNLIDMTLKNDASSISTAIMPRGYRAYSGGSWAIGDDMFAPEEELYPNGRDAEMYPQDVHTRIVTKTTWTSGVYIAKDNTAGALYVWADDPYSPGQAFNTMATGYLNFDGAYDPSQSARYPAQFRRDDTSPLDPAPPYGNGRGMRGRDLQVKFGEVYYISLEQSDGHVTYVVTAGHLGTNGSRVVDINTASSAWWPSDDRGQQYTKWDHHKVEIKKPTGTILDTDGKYKKYDDIPGLKDQPLYLYISSRGDYHDKVEWNTWKAVDPDGNPTPFEPWGHHEGDDPNNLGPAGIWKGRKIPEGLDEYITLKGLGDGTYTSYFYTVEETYNDGSQTSQEVVLDVDMSQVNGKDRTIMYPYKNGAPIFTVWTLDELMAQKDLSTLTNAEITLVNEGKYWAQVLNGDPITHEYDQGNIENYVVMGSSGGVYKWYKQRAFVRDGYFIYDVDAVKRYGRIEKIIDYSDVHNIDYLEEAALQVLYNAKFEEYSIDMTAIDAELLSDDANLTKVLDILDPVYVYSEFHNVSVTLPIEELEIPFNDLGNMSFNLSFTTTQRITSSISTKKQ